MTLGPHATPATDAADALRAVGLQVTAQRIAVHRAVSAAPHSLVDEVAVRVREAIGAVSRQAVYDSLKVMVERGLVRRIQPAGSAARYECRVGDNHHHLVCRRCDAVVDISCAAGHTPCLAPDHDHGFLIDEAEVVYWGVCPACQHGTA